VLAYCAAKLCGIANMEETTKVKMEEYRKGLSVFDLQLTAEEVSSKLPRSNDWFSEQIHKWIKDELMADVTLFTKGQILRVIGRSAIFDRACVKSIGELYSELLADRTHPVINGDSMSHEKESTSRSLEISNVPEAPDHVKEVQPEPVPVPTVELAPKTNGEVTKPNGIVKDGGDTKPNGIVKDSSKINNVDPQPVRNSEVQPTRNVEPQSTRNGLDSNTHHKEDTSTTKISNGLTVEVPAKENPRTSLSGSLQEHVKAVPENEEKDEEPTPTENLSKATDSAGDTPKSKIPIVGKKAKKGKKKGKKAETVAAPQTLNEELTE